MYLIENQEELAKGLLKNAYFEVPLIIIFLFGLISASLGTLSYGLIGIMLIAALIKLTAVIIFCKDQIGVLLSIVLGMSGLIYTLVLVFLYFTI